MPPSDPNDNLRAELLKRLHALPFKDALDLSKNLTDLERSRLECEKLSAETTELKKPIFKKAPFWQALSVGPAIAAIITLFITYQSGWFDRQKRGLEIDRKSLDFDVKQLDARKTDLQARLDQSDQQIVALTGTITNMMKLVFDITPNYGSNTLNVVTNLLPALARRASNELQAVQRTLKRPLPGVNLRSELRPEFRQNTN